MVAHAYNPSTRPKQENLEINLDYIGKSHLKKKKKLSSHELLRVFHGTPELATFFPLVKTASPPSQVKVRGWAPSSSTLLFDLTPEPKLIGLQMDN
jgi:hypothetical protein